MEKKRFYFPEEELNNLLEKYPTSHNEIKKTIRNTEKRFNNNPEGAIFVNCTAHIHRIAETIKFIDREEGSTNLSREEINKILREKFELIKEILKDYVELREDYYDLIPIWILGTWFHKYFNTYPYLYFNAMKGSGKSRTLNLIKNFIPNGKQVNNMSESVLFRTASESSFCIDEFENNSAKEKTTLRLLLNSAYKKGSVVERMEKIKTVEGEKYEPKSYEIYCPIVIANIFGLENTLQDRCITLILEKSFNKKVVNLIENFEHNSQKMGEMGSILRVNGRDGSVERLKTIPYEWNNYVKNTNLSPLSHISHHTHNSQHSHMFEKIYKSNLTGRDFELFMPLFIIADWVGNLETIIKIAEKITSERKTKDVEDNYDVQIIDFISQYQNYEWVSVGDLVEQFRKYLGIKEHDQKWINSKWMGVALNRMLLFKEKKKSGVMKVRLDISKAKEKIRMFKEE